MHPLDACLAERAAAAALTVDESLRSALLAYYDLLRRWNAKINLTALMDRDEAIDRLLLEPIAAAKLLPRGSRLIDLGSGGGSPAIPLALALRSPTVVMVESKSRKAAFLREAARQAGLDAVVATERFEDLALRDRYRAEFEVVSMRAVRIDEDALRSAAEFLMPDGRIAVFVSPDAKVPVPVGFKMRCRSSLLPKAELVQLARDVPRGTSLSV